MPSQRGGCEMRGGLEMMGPCMCGAFDCPRCHPGCNAPVAVACDCGKDCVPAHQARDCATCGINTVCGDCRLCRACKSNEEWGTEEMTTPMECAFCPKKLGPNDDIWNVIGPSGIRHVACSRCAMEKRRQGRMVHVRAVGLPNPTPQIDDSEGSEVCAE